MNMNKLKGKMAEASLSQRKVAEMLGMSQNTLSSRINGKTPFDAEEISKLCDILAIKSNNDKADIFLP